MTTGQKIACTVGLGGGVPILCLLIMQPNHEELVGVSKLFGLIGLCASYPIYLVIRSAGASRVITRNLKALRQNGACDREELRRACLQFPRDLNLADMAAIPTSEPIPAHLLHYIGNRSPVLASTSPSDSRWIPRLAATIISLAALARVVGLAFGH